MRVAVGQRVTLDGIRSTDADDDPLTYSWQQRSGPPVTLDGANTEQPSFVPIEDGFYEFELTVTDNRGGSDISIVWVFVGDVDPAMCPRAEAGTNRTVNEGAAVRLRGGNSADPGGEPLTFDWVQVSGPPVSINGVFIVEPSFVAPQVTGADIELELELTVTNEHGCSDRDTVVITVRDRDASDPCNGVVCGDDGQFCNGVEACASGDCLSNGNPCLADEICDEEAVECTTPECITDADCGDSLFCNGEETCAGGECLDGVLPCLTSEICDEDADECTMPVCLADADCDDEDACTIDTCGTSFFCDFTGIACEEDEVCSGGVCGIVCTVDGDCDDPYFCNGTETCVDGLCQEGVFPCSHDELCYEEQMECRTDPEVFFDDFESGGGFWAPDQGIWQIGEPSTGPETAYSGSSVAATVLDGNYPHNSSRLISPSIDLPEISAGRELFLRFQHWFSFGSFSGCSNFGGGGSPVCGSWHDLGKAQIRERTSQGQWSGWTTLAQYSGASALYSNTLVELTVFAGKTVQIGFLLSYGSRVADDEGWYIDDVRVLAN